MSRRGQLQWIAKNLVELSKDVVGTIKEEGYRGRTVTVKVRFNDFKIYTRAKNFDKLMDSEEKIRRAAFDCLGRLNSKRRLDS